MIICCKDDLMKLKNEDDSKFLDLLMHYPDNIKIEQILKEALKIDSNINPEKTFDINNDFASCDEFYSSDKDDF